MAEKDARIKKLEKYIPLKETEVGSKFPSRSTKSVAAMDAADLAEGKNPGTSNKDAVDLMVNSRDMDWDKDYAESKAKAVDKKMQKASELADQYKREARGVKDTSLRGKIREVTGMAKGGMVSASKRADGCATKGKTKGRFV
jgi:hypothetical protein